MYLSSFFPPPPVPPPCIRRFDCLLELAQTSSSEGIPKTQDGWVKEWRELFFWTGVAARNYVLLTNLSGCNAACMTYTLRPEGPMGPGPSFGPWATRPSGQYPAPGRGPFPSIGPGCLPDQGQQRQRVAKGQRTPPPAGVRVWGLDRGQGEREGGTASLCRPSRGFSVRRRRCLSILFWADQTSRGRGRRPEPCRGLALQQNVGSMDAADYQGNAMMAADQGFIKRGKESPPLV